LSFVTRFADDARPHLQIKKWANVSVQGEREGVRFVCKPFCRMSADTLLAYRGSDVKDALRV